jgi:hypothetical protein
VFTCRNSAQSGSWWCDGVCDLAIEVLDRTSFRIVGAAIWAEDEPYYLAPFEIEFYYPVAQSESPLRTIVRFGVADYLGNIERTPYGDAIAGWMIGERPKRDPDWAFAVELT